MKKFITVAVMLSLLTLFSCEQNNDLLSPPEPLENPVIEGSTLEQVEWDQLPDVIKKAEQVQPTDAPFDNISDNDARACGSALYSTQAAGGNGGTSFSIRPNSNCDKVHIVYVRTGVLVDAIMIAYKRPNNTIYAKRIGGTGGTWNRMGFENNEYIEAIQGRAGIYVDRLGINTNQRTIYFGGFGGQDFQFHVAGYDREIKGIYGKSGIFIDKIGGHVYAQ